MVQDSARLDPRFESLCNDFTKLMMDVMAALGCYIDLYVPNAALGTEPTSQ